MIREIQYLRAIAAVMVVVFHTFPQLKRMGYVGSSYPVLAYGVDIFFVISGFIMVLISYGRLQTPGEFMRNRVLRIVPLYWLLTLAIAAIGIAVPSALQSSVIEPGHLLASLLFLPMEHPVNGGLLPLLQPGWTLNYEMYFYLVFASWLWIGSAWRYAVTIGVLVALTLLLQQLQLGVWSAFYGDPIVLEFCFGMVLGWLYCARPRLFVIPNGEWVGLALVVVGMGLLFWLAAIRPDADRLAAVGIPGFLVVAGCLVASKGRRRFVSSWFETLGNASYSLYLSHYIAMSAIGQISRRIVGQDPGPLFHVVFIVYATMGCILASVVLYHFVEARMQRAFKAVRSR